MFLLISWRWVRKVVAVIATTSSAARIFTLTWSVLVNESEIRAPKIVALLRWLTGGGGTPPWGGWGGGWLSTGNAARKSGFWIRSGRQGEKGFAPFSL